MAAPRMLSVEPGQFLFLQGQPSDAFYILKKGIAEVLVINEKDNPSESEVLSNARRVALLDKPNIPIGEIGVYEGTGRSASVRALEKCELMEVAGGQKALVDWVRGNLQAGLLIARTLATRVIDNHKRWHRVKILTARMRTYIENFQMLYSIFSTRHDIGTPFAKQASRGRELIAQLDQGSPPNLSNVDRNVPDENAPIPRTEPFPEIELAYFLHILLFQPDQSLEWVIAPTQPHALTFITSRLTDILPRLSKTLHVEMRAMEWTVDALFSPEGLIQAYAQMFTHLSADQKESALPYLNRLSTVARDMRESVTSLWGDTFPKLKELDSEIAALQDAASGAVVAAAPPGAAPTERAEFAGGLNLPAALDGITLSAAEKDAIAICMGTAPGEPKAAYASFWKLYARLWQCALEKPIPELTAFLRYGFACPEPWPKPPKLDLSIPIGGPIVYADQWLHRIYTSESPPSRNDLGQTMQEVLRDLKQTQYAPDEPDPHMDPVRFEVDMMIARAARAFSGGRGELATIRRTPEEIVDFSEKCVSTAKIAEALVKLIQIDFTAFIRDVRVVLEERSEFLPAEVLPYAIIIPASGDRAISWQEFEGRAKDTPGRICFPLLSEAEVFDVVILATAKFRWDLAKTIAGADWMNPAEGGMTGKYFDYCTFYKKNPALSDDQKAKLDQMFSTATMDADKFALEYAMWVKGEAQGVQKLNKVARTIFAEFVPFAFEIRERLVKQPAFQDILRKDSNRRLKKRQELERRIYALEKKSVAIGESFEAALRINEVLPEA